MKALHIDTGNCEIYGEVQTEKVIRDSFYYNTDKGPLPIMSLLKEEHKEEIEELLKTIREKRQELRAYEYEILAIRFTKFRI